MKQNKLACAFILILTSLFFLGNGRVVEEIVAVVNDDIITLSQYKENYRMMLQMLRARFTGEEYNRQLEIMKKNLLESMIRDLLLLQEARAKGIDVSEQVKLSIENIKKEYSLASDDQLIRVLQEQGINFSAWKQKMEEEFLRQAVIYSEVERAIVLDDSEIVSYYKQHPEEFTEPPEYRIRAIYLSSEGRTKEEAKLKMEEIIQKLQNGEEMDTLAALYSEGPEKESQGDLGTFKKGELEKSLEEAVEKLEPGETTPWLETKAGWYLLKLEEKKESRLKSFDEVKKDIENKLFTERKQKKLEEYLKKLRENSYVKILNPNPVDN